VPNLGALGPWCRPRPKAESEQTVKTATNQAQTTGAGRTDYQVGISGEENMVFDSVDCELRPPSNCFVRFAFRISSHMNKRFKSILGIS
jgi:hypothetical protein